MSIVYSGGNLRMVNLGDEATVTPARWLGGGRGVVTLADPAYATYDAIYTSQRWVRTAVDFLARNVAQCQVHAYRRLPNDDRVRLRSPEHPFAALLAAPDPTATPPLTSYRWVVGMVADGAVYGNAYVIKRPDPDQQRQFRLARAEPGNLYHDPTDPGRLAYVRPGVPREYLDLRDVIWLRAWSPTGVPGLSLLEPLREMLHEEYEATVYRGQLWRSGARMSGWIGRPKESPWSSEARERFQQDWRATYSGSGPDAGGTPLLEDGMEFHGQTFSAEQAQFLQTRELAREEVAAALQIQPTMLGMTKGATYSNTREHHQMLYQDTLGPIFGDLEQELMLQLLPDIHADNDGVYCEFNIAEKLSGTFEEQAAALQAAVGRPWLTANEARARMNLPRIESTDADSLVIPLNVAMGGSTTISPEASGPPTLALLPAPRKEALPATKATSQAELDRYQEELTQKLARYFRRQGSAVGSALGAGLPLPDAFDLERWDPELADLLLRQSLPIASLAAQMILATYAGPGVEWSDDPMLGRLSAYSGSAAKAINITTYDAIAEGIAGGDLALRDLFTQAMSVRAPQQSQTATTYAHNLGQSDAASVAGLRFKTWQVTSSKPRPSHAALSGERVPIGEVFSNGARYPGDPFLGVDDRAGCTCRVAYSAEEG